MKKAPEAQDVVPGEVPWKNERPALKYGPALSSLTPSHPGKKFPCYDQEPVVVASVLHATAKRLNLQIETCRYQAEDGSWWVAVRLRKDTSV